MNRYLWPTHPRTPFVYASGQVYELLADPKVRLTLGEYGTHNTLGITSQIWIVGNDGLVAEHDLEMFYRRVK